MSLMAKLQKNSKIADSAPIKDSKVYGKKEMVDTGIPALNIACSGMLDGGISPGLLMIAGNSKHFKTGFALTMAAAYQKRFDDAAILFYDSEFGAPESYLKMFGVDTDRIMHTPITDVEQLKFDIMAQLKGIDKNDHPFILIDSVGNLASKKEVEDAENEKSAADMTRAKAFKSLGRMITPHLTMKNIPMVVINHVYKDIGVAYAKDIVGGGCVVEGTKITMYDGSLKNVEDIKQGEYVQTKLGPREVTYTWNPDTLEEGSPDCYEIEFEDGFTVTVSERHKFLVNGNWIEARELVVGIDCEVCL